MSRRRAGGRRRRSAPLVVQIVLLLLVTLAAAQAVNAVLVLSSSPPERVGLERVGEVADALAGRRLDGGEGRFTVTSGERPPFDNREDPGEREFRDALAQHLGAAPADVRVVMRAGLPGSGLSAERGGPGTPSLSSGIGAARPDRPVEAFSAAVRQSDGLWRVAAEPRGLLDPWQRRALFWLLGSVLLASPLGVLFARRLTAPIRTFAEAAERLGRDPRAPALAAEGPAEIGAAARAFNEMQERSRRYVDDRTAMVGAIAHDLRTPLTRLAFRLEAAPEELHVKAAGDIAEMEAMIAAALAFVRDPARRSPAARVGLPRGERCDRRGRDRFRRHVQGRWPVGGEGRPGGTAACGHQPGRQRLPIRDAGAGERPQRGRVGGRQGGRRRARPAGARAGPGVRSVLPRGVLAQPRHWRHGAWPAVVRAVIRAHGGRSRWRTGWKEACGPA